MVTNVASNVGYGLAQAECAVSVLVPQAVDKSFTYLAETALAPGSLVTVNFAGRTSIGVVWDSPNQVVSMAKLKRVLGRVEGVSLGANYRGLIDWVAEFTLAPLGAVLALANLPLATKTPRKPYVAPHYQIKLPELTAVQHQVADSMITRCLRQTAVGEHKPILLDGVTGSGKTEVYFHLIAEMLKGRSLGAKDESLAMGVAPPYEREGEASTHLETMLPQTLVLLPEIALTHQWLTRFEAAFGAKPVVWHSGQTPAARARAWHAIAQGKASVVVGARSALFLPFKNLKLIVVDEEHDPSYKQDEGVLYHARDMAVARAKFEHIPIVLASATPSLETLYNVERARYISHTLPDRFGAAGMPHVALVDMRQTPPARGEFLSPVVKEKLLETLAKGEQSLLFLNRRGYAPMLLCRGCGHRFECADCSAWLVVHGKKGLLCHHCGHHESMPVACPACQAPAEKLAPCGPGVERIAEEVSALFAVSPNPQPSSPSPNIAILSSDESVAAETWGAIERGNVDILIGTQMAAKGHHFPHLTFVAVVDADMGLDASDLRATERSYQLLHQLGGRAGREARRGEVLVQTYLPQHPVMHALLQSDRTRLTALEIAARQAGHWPPFGHLAAIILDGSNEGVVRKAAQVLAQSAPIDPRLTVLGPAPAPLSKLRGQYRFRLLVKAQKSLHLQRTLRNWLVGKRFAGVRLKVDVNPHYFL